MQSFLIVEDREIIRTGFRTLIAEQFPDAEVEEVETEIRALDILQKKAFRIILLSADIPGFNFTKLIKTSKSIKPYSSVVLFTSKKDNIHILENIKVGAKGFVNLTHEMEVQITEAIKEVLLGNIYMSEKIRQSAVESLLTDKIDTNPFNALSDREIEITRMLLEGKKTTEIAVLLNLKVSTVSTHKKRIFNKLSLNQIKPMELIDLARRYNFIAKS